MRTNLFVLLSLLIFISPAKTIFSQECACPIPDSVSSLEENSTLLDASVNADIVSHYVARGVESAELPCIQPSFNLTYGNLYFTAWGSYQIGTGKDLNIQNEINLWLGYSFTQNYGTFTFSFLDYYFPENRKIGNFSNYNGKKSPGSHMLETNLLFNGGEDLPFYVFGAVDIYNDAGFNKYFEAGYFTHIKDTYFTLYTGITPGSKKNPDLYGAEKFSLINLGLRAERKIKISSDFCCSFFGSIILNPKQEKAFIIFGISL